MGFQDQKKKYEPFYQKQRNAAILASGYSWKKRTSEIISTLIFTTLFTSLSLKLLSSLSLNTLWTALAGCLVGMALSDFISGMVHWGADTWGTVDTPVFNVLIRSFREHHVDPMAITRHDFIEANGDNCMAVLPVLFALQLWWFGTSGLSIFILSFGLFLSLWIAMTNQIHKWAHSAKKDLPPYVQLMQRFNIILSRKGHKNHHMSPFDRDYCITNGWLNPVLSKIGFWKALEDWITQKTGEHPRVDDALWTLQTTSPSSPSSLIN